jgi:hypothetical protein
VHYFGISLNIVYIYRITYISFPVHVNAIDVFQPILSNSKLIDKSADYRYLHPWLGTGLLTSAGEIIFLNCFIYSIALRIIQLTLWGLVEMRKKCCEFNVYGSVHRKYIPIYIQQDATLHSLFISANCCTCFGWYHHPSSGAHTNVSTASGICHTVTAICRYRGRVGTGLSVLWVACTLEIQLLALLMMSDGTTRNM